MLLPSPVRRTFEIRPEADTWESDSHRQRTSRRKHFIKDESADAVAEFVQTGDFCGAKLMRTILLPS